MIQPINDFSELQWTSDVSQGNSFLPIRKRRVRRVLQQLDEHRGTGLDGISSRILWQCRDALELPVLLLARGRGSGECIGSTHYIRRSLGPTVAITAGYTARRKFRRSSNAWWHVLFCPGRTKFAYFVKINTRTRHDGATAML